MPKGSDYRETRRGIADRPELYFAWKGGGVMAKGMTSCRPPESEKSNQNSNESENSLKESENLQSNLQPTCNLATDCISRREAIDAICTEGTRLERNGTVAMVEIKQWCVNILEALPSAQPDIIACGDCKHWICHDRRCGYWNHGVKPLEWCCHAERRTDDT